ncbi:dihydrofolate reductase family protein [Streptomyces sp. NBC_00201]|uniref:dihydrofolate reductase family protein n=1 Tax=unclassified Streptomyces TaxID=2593676 RepID=UPI00224ED437|nr:MULTISPECIES: dihydrofolate reductase family protein [unclassified Streptomyces]MCX5047847.1 dihydrofolate reductase family protein [Streptomyces sp. NBC_00474]MCX5057450.1 dihydrofolate reductase family protein [Streptomyces sp. NBC_00452]MCX5245675.1 dihydrofolate reductase family protein [Streptomyces sp. NBC_00201]MCX5288524.1 dihydrofolate reductase family protein [Streptomyces sp. NBC_00183]
MSEVIARLAMSLDGYIAGPESGREHPLGIGGERLHSWVYGLRTFREMQGMKGGTTGPDDDLIAEHVVRPGAVVMGHGMFVTGEIPWGEEPPFHAPVYVVTHHARESVVKKGGTTYHFVTEGPERALELAREAADGKDVSLAGGADLVQQFIRNGRLDELLLHVVPVLACGGRRLFDNLGDQHIEWEKTQVLDSAGVTHIRLRSPHTVSAE